jgi:hypothetical protein
MIKPGLELSIHYNNNGLPLPLWIPLDRTTTWRENDSACLADGVLRFFNTPRQRFQVCLLPLSPNVDIIYNVTRHTFACWGFTSCQKLFLFECQLSPYTSNPGADWIPGNKRIGRGSRLKNSSVSLNTVKYFVNQPSVDGYFGIKVLNHPHLEKFPLHDFPASF